jgi:hypothetical protein
MQEATGDQLSSSLKRKPLRQRATQSIQSESHESATFGAWGGGQVPTDPVVAGRPPLSARDVLLSLQVLAQ